MRWRPDAALTDAELRARTEEFKQRIIEGTTLDALLAGGVCGGARSEQAGSGNAPFRRAIDRRHGAARGKDRRDAHRGRQNT